MLKALLRRVLRGLGMNKRLSLFAINEVCVHDLDETLPMLSYKMNGFFFNFYLDDHFRYRHLVNARDLHPGPSLARHCERGTG